MLGNISAVLDSYLPPIRHMDAHGNTVADVLTPLGILANKGGFSHKVLAAATILRLQEMLKLLCEGAKFKAPHKGAV